MLNRVVLVGRLTKDPELRYTSNGVAVATFTLAVNRPFTNQKGEREADFINCVVWRRHAENVANFLHKGSLAGVDGRIQSRSYENNEGRRIFITEVLCESVQFLEPKGSNNGGSNNDRNNNERYNKNNNQSNDNYNKNINESNNQNKPYNNSNFNGNNPYFEEKNKNNKQEINDDPFATDREIDISDDDLPF